MLVVGGDCHFRSCPTSTEANATLTAVAQPPPRGGGDGGWSPGLEIAGRLRKSGNN
jgi:hypothetical protein